MLVVALFTALSGTPAHAQGPTSAADQFQETIPSTRNSANSARIPVGRLTYLSAVIPVSVSNGHGPLESDMSNGEQRVGDGKAITLNGATYLKGLGTHAASRVRYASSKPQWGSTTRSARGEQSSSAYSLTIRRSTTPDS